MGGRVRHVRVAVFLFLMTHPNVGPAPQPTGVIKGQPAAASVL
jgi:hypothetical protein